ncbi:MAG: DNA-directed RNA polymerase subunit beta', partial [Candidatus Omnitrophica bacterium]|nr:DNA-directed RNA polymerase subunit beta' [Candidatus Omnitrophota bacterium]
MIIEHKENLEPTILIERKGKRVAYYPLPVGANLVVREGQRVRKSDLIAKMPRVSGRMLDITGGLPRVSELFEARHPKNPAILGEIDGVVKISKGSKGERIIQIRSSTGTVQEESIPVGKRLNVLDGEDVIAGEKLTDGPIVLDDILKVGGERKVREYLLNEIQEVYRLEGVTINDKHLEIIIRQMLSKVRVKDPGDTLLLEGEEIDRFKFQEINEGI